MKTDDTTETKHGTCSRSGRPIEGDKRCGQCRFVGLSAPFELRPETGELRWPVCPAASSDPQPIMSDEAVATHYRESLALRGMVRCSESDRGAKRVYVAAPLTGTPVGVWAKAGGR